MTYFVSRDWRLLSISFFLILQTLYTLACSFLVNDHFLPRGQFVLLLVTTLISLVLMPIFFVVMLGLLKPKKMLLRMLTLALQKARKADPSVEFDTETIAQRKLEVCQLLESVASIGQGAIRLKNKTLSYFAVEAIRRFCASYGKNKIVWEEGEGDEWFQVRCSTMDVFAHTKCQRLNGN